MNINGWLSAHEEGAPDTLRQSVRIALGDDLARPVVDAPSCFVAAGERVLRTVIHSDAASRDTALALLTADALLTYAFESGSEVSVPLNAVVADAVRRINVLDVDLPPMQGPR